MRHKDPDEIYEQLNSRDRFTPVERAVGAVLCVIIAAILLFSVFRQLNVSDSIVTVSSARSDSALQTDSVSPAVVVNINTASIEQLQYVCGITEKAAKTIATHRAEYGDFNSTHELVENGIISESTYGEIKDALTV